MLHLEGLGLPEKMERCWKSEETNTKQISISLVFSLQKIKNCDHTDQYTKNAEHTLAKLREPNPSQQKTRPPAPIIMNTATQRTSTRDPILNQVFENYWYMI